MGFRNASFVLNTSNAIANTLNTSFTWNNINLRTILGEMYEQYDIFNLCLNSITSSVAGATIGTTADDNIILIQISGLPFINQTYNYNSGNNTNTATICPFSFVKNNSVSQLFYSNNVLTFSKYADQFSLTISYSKVVNGQSPASPVAYPTMAFLFTIQGVQKNDYNLPFLNNRIV